ncbi:MAG: hypothetical protein ACT4ON_03755 [Bacteroidota bacterium]
MKGNSKIKYILSIATVLMVVYFSNAQSKKYIASMEKNIVFIDTIRGIESLQKLANTFEQLSELEKSEWLPLYYTAYCYVTMAQGSKGNTIDIYCDKAEIFINKADLLSPNNSEIYVIKAQIAAARINVNIAKRGAKFGQQSTAMLTKAKTLDATNPRPWLVQGQSKFYTPPAFGGGKQKAKPAFEKALELYETFKPANTIHPNWGKRVAVYFLKKCNE